jgi:uncharacterized protein (TIGR02452 family)
VPTSRIATPKTHLTPMLPTRNTSAGGVMTISGVPCLPRLRRSSVTWSTSLTDSRSQPEMYAALLAGLATLPAPTIPTIQVLNCTTLAAARMLATQFPSVACLNFASAKNPGGGFLSGSQAQEESLARASGLYATLRAQPEFYDQHRRLRTSLYSDRVIFSPGVPVFRDAADRLIAELWQTTFISAAAVNAGAVRQNEPRQVGRIVPVMEQRTRMVLAVAAAHGCEALVLGAWGCGVFHNDPATIAGVFSKVLAEAIFQGRFKHMAFAIYDRAPQPETFTAFQRLFGS